MDKFYSSISDYYLSEFYSSTSISDYYFSEFYSSISISDYYLTEFYLSIILMIIFASCYITVKVCIYLL